MAHLPLDLTTARDQFQRACQVITAAYERRAPDHTEQVTPGQLEAAIAQFFSVAARLDQEQSETGAVAQGDVSEIGDYGLQLISDLSRWAAQLDLELPRRNLEDTALAAASWIIRHKGQIRTPEIIVDGLARLANATEDTLELATLTDFMAQVLQSLAAVLREDLERNNPGRAWRILHLNRAIVATRSYDPDRIQEAFDALIQALPDEAPEFFTEGIAQMDKFDYPDHVRAIMQRYFDIWGRSIMH